MQQQEGKVCVLSEMERICISAHNGFCCCHVQSRTQEHATATSLPLPKQVDHNLLVGRCRKTQYKLNTNKGRPIQTLRT